MEDERHQIFDMEVMEKLILYINSILVLFLFGSMVYMSVNYSALKRFDPPVTGGLYYSISAKFTLHLLMLVLSLGVVVYNLFIFNQHGFGFTMISFLACGLLSPLCVGVGFMGKGDQAGLTLFFDLFFSQKFDNETVDSMQRELQCCGLNRPLSRDMVLSESCCMVTNIRKEIRDCTLNLAWKNGCNVLLKRKIYGFYAWANCLLIGLGSLLGVTFFVYYAYAMAIKYYYYY